MNKTEEMIVDSRRPGHTHKAIQINEEKMEIVHSYEYHRTIFEDIMNRFGLVVRR